MKKQKYRIVEIAPEDAYFDLKDELIGKIGAWEEHGVWKDGFVMGDFVPDDETIRKEFGMMPFYRVKVEKI